jgi:amidophosphoribosyltransferase
VEYFFWENIFNRLGKSDLYPEEISDQIAKMITPKEIDTDVQVIYQNIEDLHDSCPTNTGDWYFTGNYPTPGGNKVCNKSFLNYIEGKNVRGY